MTQKLYGGTDSYYPMTSRWVRLAQAPVQFFGSVGFKTYSYKKGAASASKNRPIYLSIWR
jgi:hypothetical protein